MKKIISVLICLLMLTAVLCSCGKNESKKSESFTVKLKANGTTGYHWKYEVSEKDAVKISDDYVVDKHPEGMVGVGGTQIYKITPKKSGNITITFNYLSPGTEETAYSAVYEFEIDKNLNIKEKSHSGDYFEQD